MNVSGFPLGGGGKEQREINAALGTLLFLAAIGVQCRSSDVILMLTNFASCLYLPMTNVVLFHHIRTNMPQDKNSDLDLLSDAPKCSPGAVASLPPLGKPAVHSFTCLCFFAAAAGVLQTPACETDPTSCVSCVCSSLQTSLAPLAAVAS